MSLRRALIHELSRAGLRLDDAALAAAVALACLREQRNASILAAHRAGMSSRQIGAVFGISKSQVHRVLTQ